MYFFLPLLHRLCRLEYISVTQRNMKSSSKHENNMPRKRTLNFEQIKTVFKNYGPIVFHDIWSNLLRFKGGTLPRLTRCILTKKPLIISSQNFSCEPNSLKSCSV